MLLSKVKWLLSVSLEEHVTLFTANASAFQRLNTYEEIEAAGALLYSFTSSCGKESPEKELTVFLWGGLTSIGINLNNSCPSDDWLMIFQALVKSRKVNLADLTESGQIIGSALRLIDDGQFLLRKLVV